MSTESNNGDQVECLSEYDRDTKLPDPIPFTRIAQEIENINSKAQKYLRKKFRGTSGASQLTQHRGRLGTLLTNVYGRLGLKRKEDVSGEIITVGSLRSLGRRIQTELTNAAQPGVKGGMLDSETLAQVRRLFADKAEVFVTEIRREFESQKLPSAQIRKEAPPITVEIPMEVPKQEGVQPVITLAVPEAKSIIDLPPSNIESGGPAPIEILKKVKNIENPAVNLSFAEIVELIESVAHFTHGDEYRERQVCTKIGLEWSTLRIWKAGFDNYKVAAEIMKQIDEGAVTSASIPKNALQLVMYAMRQRYPNLSEMITFFKQIGLYPFYYRLNYQKQLQRKRASATSAGQIALRNGDDLEAEFAVPKIQGAELDPEDTTNKAEKVDRFANLPQSAANILRQRELAINALENGQSGIKELLDYRGQLVDEMVNI